MVDVSRQTRARALLRAQLDADVLGPVRAASSEAGLWPRDFVTVRSGSTELEQCSTSGLTSGAHLLVDACTNTFTDLLLAADNLIQMARNSLYDSILLYGEDAEHLLDRDGGVIDMVSDFLPHLLELTTFVRQCERVAGCMLRQLHALFNLRGDGLQLVGARDLPMGRVWRTMGDLLSVLIVFDEVTRAHPFLSQHWSQFVRSIRLVQHNPSQFELHAHQAGARLQQLNAEIARLDAELMGGDIFKKCCQSIAASSVPLSGDRAFLDRFRRTIMDSLARWERVSAASETNVPDKQRLLALLALTQLYHSLLLAGDNTKAKKVDRKMLRALCATHKTVVAFHLVGDIMFTPAQYIAHTFASVDADAIDRKTMASVAQARAALLDHQVEQMDKEAQAFELCVAEWCQKMDDFGNCPPANGDTLDQISSQKCNLLLQGAHIADRLGRIVKCVLNGHLAENRALTKHNARLLFAYIQHIKRISDTFNLHWPAVLEWARSECCNSASAVLRLLESQLRVLTSKNAPHTVAALQNAQLALAQPAHKAAIVRCGAALEMANYAKLLRPLEVQQVDDHLMRLDLLWNLGSLFHRVSDLSFLHWHRHSLCDAFCSSLLNPQDPQPNVYNTKNFFGALNDSTHLFRSAAHCDQEALIKQFSREMFDIFKEKFLDKLCTQIENHLRLSFHSLQSATFESVEKQLFGGPDGGGELMSSTSSADEEATARLFHLLHLPRFQLGDKLVDVKAFVTVHLESTFYNLSVLALHDCESYRRMALLAELRYKLHLADPGLPDMSVDQGLDLLKIMADPDSFVANYFYCLNEQFFMERNGYGKSQLNIVRVQQVVNSIKTHGLGIMNTVVNSAYKFLRVQFQRLSHCLFDERVKALLVQEIRYYRDAVDQLDQMYPMARAEKLANVLKRYENPTAFGEESNKKGRRDNNFLEQFRIRTGAVEFCAPVIFHRPNTDPTKAKANDHDVGEQQQLDGLALDCVRLRDRALHNTWSHLTGTNDCIEKLTAVFAREFRSNATKYSHLRHFFVVVPALSLSQVEHTMACRARVQSVGRRAPPVGEVDSEELAFVEDGFGMGVAYILTLLNQCFFFNSLNWHDSAQSHFRAEMEKCAEEQKVAQKRKDESLGRVLAVKMSELEERMADHRLEACALNSAMTMFQADELLGDDENGEETAFLEDL